MLVLRGAPALSEFRLNKAHDAGNDRGVDVVQFTDQPPLDVLRHEALVHTAENHVIVSECRAVRCGRRATKMISLRNLGGTQVGRNCLPGLSQLAAGISEITPYLVDFRATIADELNRTLTKPGGLCKIPEEIVRHAEEFVSDIRAGRELLRRFIGLQRLVIARITEIEGTEIRGHLFIRMSVGDALSVSSGDKTCKIFFMQVKARNDGRVGFDISCG